MIRCATSATQILISARAQERRGEEGGTHFCVFRTVQLLPQTPNATHERTAATRLSQQSDSAHHSRTHAARMAEGRTDDGGTADGEEGRAGVAMAEGEDAREEPDA